MKSTDYAQFGMAALIPGWQHAIDQLQQQLDAFRAELAAGQQEVTTKPRRKPKPAGGEPISPQKAYWSSMSPKQRRAEMKRRGMIGSDRRVNPWKNLSPAARKARVAKILRTREANRAALAETPTMLRTA